MRSTRTSLLALLALLGGLLTVTATASPAAAAPNFKAPYGCGQQWTYSHLSAEVLASQMAPWLRATCPRCGAADSAVNCDSSD
ncbi:hypothetical protein ACH4RG_24730 [Streptomyces sp. NPDC021019]|uniref:hypothetical protein n=1 Tax=Streptomyces sp. NPDC021019 TaxID=3365108 RepID=UPI0037BCCAC3